MRFNNTTKEISMKFYMALQVWWKEQRKKDNRRKPLIHFLFGGEGRFVFHPVLFSLVLSRRILPSINSSLGPLYSTLLNLKRNPEDVKEAITVAAHLEDVRKLIALVAHLLAFHDAQVV